MRRCISLLGVWVILIGLGTCQTGWASDLSEVLFTKGIMYYDQGRYDLALENLREALREDPANLEIRKFVYQAEARTTGKPSPIAVFEEAVKRDPRSAKNHLNLAAALILEGQNERAMGSIEEANRLTPNNSEILFFRGLIRFRQGAFRDSISDFRQARSVDARMAQGAMYYEATAMMKLQERETAQDLYRQVMIANPATDYAVEAAKFAQDTERRRFSATITTGVEYDTNVTLVGRENTLGVPLDLPDRFQLRFPISALLDYRFYDVGQWSFGGRYGFYTSFHDESSDFNMINNLAELYGVWRSGGWYARPFYYYQSSFLGGDQLSDTHSIGGNLMYYTPYNLAPELYIRAQTRDYHFATTNDSDPDSGNLRGEFNVYYLLPGGQGYFRGGLGMEGNLADGDNMDYTAFLLLAGFQYQLPWKLLFNFDFEFQKRSFSRTNTIFGIQQDDHQYSFAWQLSRPIGYGVEAKARVAHIRNDSNIGDLDYDRQIYSLLFSWSY